MKFLDNLHNILFFKEPWQPDDWRSLTTEAGREELCSDKWEGLVQKGEVFPELAAELLCAELIEWKTSGTWRTLGQPSTVEGLKITQLGYEARQELLEVVDARY